MEHLSKKKMQNPAMPASEQTAAELPANSMLEFYQKAGNQAMSDMMGLQPHTSGLSQQMQSKVQRLTGLDLSDVSVTHNSDQPGRFDAHSFTNGSQIHLAPGREQDLGHELWHVVQQRQGSVSATGSAGGIRTNESPALEHEADTMGARLMSGPVSGAMPAAAPQTAAPAPAAPVLQFKKRSDAKDATGWKWLRDQFFGKHEKRKQQKGFSERLIFNEVVGEDGKTKREGKQSNFTKTAFTTQNENQPSLRGAKYLPMNKEMQEKNGKAVIVFSGTGGSNFDQMQEIIDQYTKEGYIVYGADYRGFGANAGDEDFVISEKSLNEDAHNIFDYVRSDIGANDPESGKGNNDIILHGFSMGGAVASRLAADVSEQAQAAGDDSLKLGGLTLHSSMKDLYHAAHSDTGGGLLGKIAGSLSKKHLGHFSVEDALEDIHEADSTLPVNFISGSDSKLNDSLKDAEFAKSRAAIKAEKAAWKKEKKANRRAAKKQGKEAVAQNKLAEKQEEQKKRAEWAQREKKLNKSIQSAQSMRNNRAKNHYDQLSLNNTGLGKFALEKGIITSLNKDAHEGGGSHLVDDSQGVSSAPASHVSDAYFRKISGPLKNKRTF